MRLSKSIYKRLLLGIVSILLLSSCSMMTEEEPDCNPYYKVRFRFDRNMQYADAFSTQVGEVDLYVFDKSGKLVWSGHESGSILSEEGYMMDLPVAPGNYDIVAWCRKRHENAAGFNMAGGATPTSFQDLRMTMEREHEGSKATSQTDLDALFHGIIKDVELPDEWGVHTVTMPLTKDTNSIRIMLVHLNGEKVNERDFEFKITDSNGYLDSNNAILEDETIEYRPWAVHEGIAQTLPPIVTEEESRGRGPAAGRGDGSRSSGGNSFARVKKEASENIETGRGITEIHSLVAEMTTSRLQTCRRPVLTVTRRYDGVKIIEIPINDYFLMVRSEHFRQMEEDEFLDRQDDYSMTLFLDENNSWYKAVVDILSWRLVLQGTDL